MKVSQSALDEACMRGLDELQSCLLLEGGNPLVLAVAPLPKANILFQQYCGDQG